MTSVYLAGPIAGFDDPKAWRVHAKKRLAAHGIKGIDPFEEEVEANPSHAGYQPRSIVARDYMHCVKSDVVLVYLLHATRVSIGTVMEIAWAHALNKPCYVVLPEDAGHLHDHCMIEGVASAVVHDLDEALELCVLSLRDYT